MPAPEGSRTTGRDPPNRIGVPQNDLGPSVRHRRPRLNSSASVPIGKRLKKTANKKEQASLMAGKTKR